MPLSSKILHALRLHGIFSLDYTHFVEGASKHIQMRSQSEVSDSALPTFE